MRLTRQTVARLTLPKGKTDTIFFDDTLAGFGVRIRAGGKRTWIVQYRAGGKTNRESLGPVEAVGLDEARVHARKMLAAVHLGTDPRAEKNAALAPAVSTLGELTPRYLKHVKPKLRPRSFEEVQRYLDRHWAPLHTLPIDAVSRRDIAECMSGISAQRGPVAANRARAALSSFFTWLMRQGEVEANPVIATAKETENDSRDRVLTVQELAAVWHGCRNDNHGRIVRLLILTGQRREEVGSMRWSELDLTPGKAVWRLPASRTKNKKPHDVPLTDAALKILRETPRHSEPDAPGGERDLIFGQGKTGSGFQGWSRSKSALDARIKIGPWRLHDLRRTLVTGMNELRIQPHVVEAIVNHISGAAKSGVAGIYNRATYATEKREALNAWDEHVQKKIRELMWE